MLPWQPYLKSGIYKNHNYTVPFMFFLSVKCSRVGFDHFLVNSGGFLNFSENQEEMQEVGPIWPPFGKHNEILMTCDFDNSCRKPQIKKKHFGRAMYPSSLITVALRLPEIFMEKGEIHLISGSRRPERKPSLERVTVWFTTQFSHTSLLCCCLTIKTHSRSTLCGR